MENQLSRANQSVVDADVYSWYGTRGYSGSRRRWLMQMLAGSFND